MKRFLLLDSLSEIYKDVKTAMKYGRNSITVGIIISAIRFKEMELLTNKEKKTSAEGLFVKGKNKQHNKDKGKLHSSHENRSKSKLR